MENNTVYTQNTQNSGIPYIPQVPLPPQPPTAQNGQNVTIQTFPNTQETGFIQPNIVPIETMAQYNNTQLLQDVLESEPEIPLQSKKKLSIRIIEFIIEFEEKHPWIFFFIIATLVFFIIVAILSFVISPGDNSQKNNDKEEQEISLENINQENNSTELTNKSIVEPEENNQTPVEKKQVTPPSYGLNLVYDSITVSSLLLDTQTFDNLIFKTNGEIYLGEYFTDSQNLEILLQRDIQTELSQAEDKKELLNQFIIILRNQSSQSKNNYQTILTLSEELSTQQKTIKTTLQDIEKKITLAFNTGKQQELLSLMEQYQNNLNEYASISNKINIIDMLSKIYKKRIPVSEARLTAVRENYDALVNGITITPVDNSGIDFTKDLKPSAPEEETKSLNPLGTQTLQSIIP